MTNATGYKVTIFAKHATTGALTIVEADSMDKVSFLLLELCETSDQYTVIHGAVRRADGKTVDISQHIYSGTVDQAIDEERERRAEAVTAVY